MTAQQRQALDRAIARATRDRVIIAGYGTRKSDGARVYGIPSSSNPSRWYLVAVEKDRLTCDCIHGKRGGICKHRARVHEELRNAYREALRLADIKKA